MPKVIELTVELNVQKVSCPGVWLCQDGRVALTVFALGTSYQTCMMPPIFPLMFNDVFYFRKRFEESCALNNICCLLKDETIYCELVQFCDDCHANECTILAQYLGALNEVLFPSNMCSNEGVDLLMRRSKEFPGILSPKIEIMTKVRIDELWDQTVSTSKSLKIKACSCKRPDSDGVRQKQVCHTPLYHRIRCTKKSASRSRSRSNGSVSCCSLSENDPDISCSCPKFINAERNNFNQSNDKIKRQKVESQYIDQDRHIEDTLKHKRREHNWFKFKPCVCEICKRYHELFHANRSKS